MSEQNEMISGVSIHRIGNHTILFMLMNMQELILQQVKNYII